MVSTDTTCCNYSKTGWNQTLENNTTANATVNVTDSGSNFSGDSQAGLAALFTLTMLLSIVGNLFVVLVFARGRRSRTDLRPFLVNLAVADLIMAIFCMPFTFIYTMLKTWIFSKPLCPIVLFVQLCSVSGSVFTNMAIGIDRFLAVTFPLRSRLTNKRAKYVIITIWICAVALSSVQFKIAHAVDYGPGRMVCEEVWPSMNARRTYTVFIFVLTYLIPLLILSITYSIVAILLWKRITPGNRDHARDMHQLRSKRKVVKMLVIVVAMFGVCWLPLHMFTLILDFYPAVMHTVDYHVLTSLFICCHWLAMSNSFANPIIYGFTNESFRADLLTLFYMWFPCCVCLTKILPRHSSGSTYETVVFRRQSLYKQACVQGGSYKTRTIRTPRENKPYLNGHRNKYEYEDMCERNNSDKSRNKKVANGRLINNHVSNLRGDLEYVRLKRLSRDVDNSISEDSGHSVNESLQNATST